MFAKLSDLKNLNVFDQLGHLSKNGSVAIVDILDHCGLSIALSSLKFVKNHDREIRLYSVWCATQVKHLMGNDMSFYALDLAERYANKDKTINEDVFSAAILVIGSISYTRSSTEENFAQTAAYDALRNSPVAAATNSAKALAEISHNYDASILKSEKEQTVQLRIVLERSIPEITVPKNTTREMYQFIVQGKFGPTTTTTYYPIPTFSDDFTLEEYVSRAEGSKIVISLI